MKVKYGISSDIGKELLSFSQIDSGAAGQTPSLFFTQDERNQILTTNCWLTQVWTDYHLTWNSSDFGGIQKIRMPYFRVWKPDIILYNK